MSEKKAETTNNRFKVYNFSEIFQLIYKINKKYEKLQRGIIQEENLTSSQYSILQQLWKSDSKPFKALATACCCSSSTITGVIDTMEKKDLVVREMNPNDRRSLLVVLTDKGKTLKKVTPPIDSILKNCCEGIKPEEIEQLTTLLKKLSDSFELGEQDEC